MNERRLHQPAMHLCARLVPAVMFVFVVSGASLAILGGAPWSDGLPTVGLCLALGWFLRATYWRTQPVHASATHLIVGRGRHQRQIPFSDLVSRHRPWWAFNLRGRLQTIVLRDGSEVLFFPDSEAEDFLRIRMS
jgi:hypothetical protein